MRIFSKKERKWSGRGKEDTNPLYGKQESPFKTSSKEAEPQR